MKTGDFRMRALFFTSFVIFPLIWFGCSKEGRPPASPPSDSIVRLHADMLILEEQGFLRHDDSSMIARGRDSLFVAHKMTREEYVEAIAAYKSDMEQWKEFNLRVIARLQELQKLQSKGKDSVKGSEDRFLLKDPQQWGRR